MSTNENINRRVRNMEARIQRERPPLPRPVLPRSSAAVSLYGDMLIAEVKSDSVGGGYYVCRLQTLDATDWDTNTDALDDVTTGPNVVVLNLAENGSAIHNLDAGDLIRCAYMLDDEGNRRLVGVEVLGRHHWGEW